MSTAERATSGGVPRYSERRDRLTAIAMGLYGLILAALQIFLPLPQGTAASYAAPVWTDGRPAWFLNCIRLTLDDGFYYYAVADNAARGAGLTFDGVTQTNGYHLLWLLILMPVVRLAGSRDVALLLGVALQAVIFAVSIALTYRIARLGLGRAAAVLGALLWAGAGAQLALAGLEWALHACVATATVFVYLRWFVRERPSSSTYILLSVLLCALFLARIDALLLAAIVITLVVWKGHATARHHHLTLVLPLVAVVVVYVFANMWLFGAPVPVSSLVKRAWSIELLAKDPVYRAQGWLAAWLVELFAPLRHALHGEMKTLALGTFGAVGFWIGGRLLVWRYPADYTRWFDGLTFAWTPFIAASASQLAIYTLLLHGSVTFKPWYFVIQPLLAAVLIAAIVDSTVRWSKRRSERAARVALTGVAAFCVAVSGVTLARIARKHADVQSQRNPLLEMTAWARRELPAGAVIGAWNAGTIGYLSAHRVVNLDGLMNSVVFYERLRNDLCSYWESAGVTHVVDVFANGSALSVVPTADTYAACTSRMERVWLGADYGRSWRPSGYLTP